MLKTLVSNQLHCPLFRYQAAGRSRMPPAAPLPPRLSTPDLSDFEEDEFWSCCKSFNRSASNVRNDCTDTDEEGDGIWDEMGK